MPHNREWFQQGQKLGNLFVLWLQARERLKGNVPAQAHLDETVKEIHLLRLKVRNNEFARQQLHLLAIQINDLEWKILQLHRF
jgi:hypothetical protein